MIESPTANFSGSDQGLFSVAEIRRLMEAELERSRQGVEGGFVSTAIHKKNEIQARIARERLANARASVQRLEVRAPVAGVLRVVEPLPPGSQLDPSLRVAELAADGDLRVEAWASADDLARLETGLGAQLEDPQNGREVGYGVVAELARSVHLAFDPVSEPQALADRAAGFFAAGVDVVVWSLQGPLDIDRLERLASALA